MNIIVIGNGFDLAHGFPTRYTDFLKYCHAYKNGECEVISDDKAIEAEFSDIIKNNAWLTYFLKITPNLDEEKTWIDFETEIRLAIINICTKASQANSKGINGAGTNDDIETIKNGNFGSFVKFESRFLSYDVSKLYNELRKFTRAFEIYCCAFINGKSGISRRYKLNEALLSYTNLEDKKAETYIVSFNYTRTFNRFYDSEERNSTINYSYVYPHGEASADVSCEPAYEGLVISGLVLGTESFEHNAGNDSVSVKMYPMSSTNFKYV